MECYLCGSKEHKKRDGSVRDDKLLEIFECVACGLVYLSSVEHIDESFYEDSKMHEEFDFKKWQNETMADDERRFDFVKNAITNKSLLDFGSGNGGFLQRAKLVASRASAVEIEKAVREFYHDNEIELFNDLCKVDKKFDFVTAFHVLEHLAQPQKILEEMKELLNDGGKIIVEVPNANDVLLSVYENDAFSHFTYWSCHLYLYSKHTLSLLAKKASLKVDFVKHIQRYPLSNHLYWLSKGKPGGHVKWGNFIDSPALSTAYEAQLASIGATDTIIAILSKED